MDGNKRINWVDIFKGLGILLVVVGHTPSPFNRYIYLFHVAAFFFISGYTTNFQNASLMQFIIAKAKKLILPYFAINLFLFFCLSIFSHFRIYSYYYDYYPSWEHIRTLFTKLYTPDLGGATWFLIVMFEGLLIVKILFWTQSKLKLNPISAFFISTLLLFVAYWLFSRQYYLEYNFDLALLAQFFISTGYFFRKYEIFENINPLVAFPASTTLMYLLANIKWGGMNWPTRNFSDLTLNLLAIFSGIYFLYTVSNQTNKYKLVNWFFSLLGRKTMVILAFHFAVFKIIYSFFFYFRIVEFSQLSQLILIEQEHWILLVVLTLIIILTGDYLFHKGKELLFSHISHHRYLRFLSTSKP